MKFTSFQRWGISVLAFVVLAVSSSFAQYATVKAKLTDASGNVLKNGYMRFQLQNCGENFPLMATNGSTVVETTINIKPSQRDGTILGRILGNDYILCGNVASTYWVVTLMKDSQTPLSPLPGMHYFICAGATSPTCYPGISGYFDPSQAMPMNDPAPTPGYIQIFGNPTRSQTWKQPVGTVGTFSGTFDFSAATINGLSGIGGGLSDPGASGLLLRDVFNHTRIATMNDLLALGAETNARKGQANGYPSLDAAGLIPVSQLGTGIASVDVCLHGDRAWGACGGGGGGGGMADPGTNGLVFRTSYNTTRAALLADLTPLGLEASGNKGAAGGYAGLDGSAKVPLSQLPTIPETQVANLTTDLGAKEAATNKGQANGYAGLDAISKVPIANIPSLPESQVSNLVTDLASKVTGSTTQIIGVQSVTGGGTLASSRTMSLLNDADTPGNSKYYGTGPSGTKGFFDVPQTAWGSIPGNIAAQSDLQTALNAKEAIGNKGSVSGYAGLDSGAKVPTVQLGGAGASSATCLMGNQSWGACGVGSPTGVNLTYSSAASLTLNAASTGAQAMTTYTPSVGQFNVTGRTFKATSWGTVQASDGSTTATLGWAFGGASVSSFVFTPGDTTARVWQSTLSCTNYTANGYRCHHTMTVGTTTAASSFYQTYFNPSYASGTISAYVQFSTSSASNTLTQYGYGVEQQDLSTPAGLIDPGSNGLLFRNNTNSTRVGVLADLTALGVAPAASPSLSGTVTLPDGTTWTAGGPTLNAPLPVASGGTGSGTFAAHRFFGNNSGGPGAPAAVVVNEADITNLTTDLGAKEATANKGQANGYASLGSGSLVPTGQLGTGTPDSTKCLFGDQSWKACGGGGGSMTDPYTPPSGTFKIVGNGWFTGNLQIDGSLSIAGPFDITSDPATVSMGAAGAGKSRIGFDTDGVLKVSENNGALVAVAKLNSNISGTAAALSAAYTDWNAGSGGASILNKPTIPAASSTTPVIDGTGAAGTGTTFARNDHVHPTDTSRAPVASPTFTGKVTTAASASGGSGFNLPHGAAPSSPADGDAWTTSSGLFARISGVTIGPFGTGSGGMVYPGAGVPKSTGAAWDTSYAAPAGALVGTTDTQALTNKDISSSTNIFPIFIGGKVIPLAAAPAGTAGVGAVTYATGQWTPTLRAGTNDIGAGLNAIPSTGATLQFRTQLPKNWNGTTQPSITIYYSSLSNTTGTVIYTVSSACTKIDGSVTDDPSFVAESAFSAQTMAAANRAWAKNGAFTALTSANGCVPQGSVIFKVVLSGTASAAISATQIVLE